MDIFLTRMEYTPVYTIGRLRIGEYSCFTLEDAVRETKINHETAIPFGRYKVIVDYSPRFKRELPHLLDVPGFKGVRIHTGNTSKDSSGCILVGKERWNGSISQSKIAFQEVFGLLKDILSREEVDLIILDGRQND